MRWSLRCLILVFAIALILVGCQSSSDATPASTEAATEAEASSGGGEAPQATNTPRPTPTPRPTLTPAPTATNTPLPTATPEPPTPTPEPTPEATVTPVPTRTPYVAAPPVAPPPASKVVTSPAVELLDDADPAPPFSIHVNANYALDDYRYLVGGVIRNDSAETYVGLGVVATFYTDKGRRYGPVHAEVPCLFLMPGAECPFVIEALSKSLVSVRLHPDGRPTDRTPVGVTLSGVGRYTDAIGYVHLTGRVTNANPFAIKNAVVIGALVDGNGGFVSLGSTVVIQTIEPNASAPFDILIEYAPYTTYRLFVQAEPK